MLAREIKHEYPSRILISGGREIGGVSSFAEGLRAGFVELGIPAEIVSPDWIYLHIRELRDLRILKILSTAAIFAAPLARRSICMAHGFPCVAYQGWLRMLTLLAALKLVTVSRGAQLISVSDYTAVHLRIIFGLRVDAVIRNPVLELFLEAPPETKAKREAIIYVGRLHRSKNVDLLLPAICEVLDENPGLRAWIVGDGPMRETLEDIVAGDDRIEFLGALTPDQVRGRLRRSRVFVSACAHEALGIAYIEALSQGCAVVMPASGGGLEIAPQLIGGRIQLFPASISDGHASSALRRALLETTKTTSLAAYSTRSVAEAYLAADANFSALGTFHTEACT